MQKIYIIFIIAWLLSSCDSIFDSKNNQCNYLPLSVNNEWVYEVDYDGITNTQTIKVVSEENGVYTLDLTTNTESTETTEDSFSFQCKVSYENEGVYTDSHKMIVTESSTSFAASSLIRLFETHYSPDRIPGQVSFENNNNTLTCEFMCTPDNTYSCNYIFSQSFEKGIGLKSWTDQKMFNNPFWGVEIDTWRGTLISATIDGKTTTY